MNINDYQGPFLGFTFCGEHSSKFKIVRINSSNKGTIPITPDFKDITIERVNADGTYYFSTQNMSITFQIDFGFDKVTESDLANLKTFFSPKKYGELIFDETPYKKYIGKIKQTASLNYIAFDQNLFPDTDYKKTYAKPDESASEEEKKQWIKQTAELSKQLYGLNIKEHNERIYKGEGSIQFICYYPYAVAPYQTLEEYENLYLDNINSNINEWKEASHIMYKIDYDKYNQNVTNNNATALNNVGDIITPISFDLRLNSGGGTNSYLEIINKSKGLLIKTHSLENGEIYHFDSEKKIIQDKNGELMNYIIVAGDFFDIDPGKSDLEFKGSVSAIISNIKYEYRYL